MKTSLKQTTQWLCLLVFGCIVSACSPSDARIIGPPECVDDAECGSGSCVDFICLGNSADATPIGEDTRLSDTSQGDANADPDTCVGAGCSGPPSCDPGSHLCGDSCFSDTSPKTCGDRCEPCPSALNGRSTCEQGACGIECNAPFIWDETAQACVQCQSDAECTDPSASSCGPDGICVACSTNEHCTHLGDTPLCAQGTCAECSDEDASACGPNSCDPATGTCTNTPRGALFACQECLSDTECQEGHACAPMDFKDAARQKMFCLPIAGEGETVAECGTPFPNIVNRASANGVPTDFCTLNEDLTTCEGQSAYGTRCGDASECGADGFFDSLCEPIDFDSAACTFPCTSSQECPTLSMMGCATGGPDSKYCGAY